MSCSCRHKQLQGPATDVSGDCRGIGAIAGAGWEQRNHGEEGWQQAWQISFAMVNQKITVL
jgi:hypothetical protein